MCSFVFLAFVLVFTKVWLQCKFSKAEPGALAWHHERDRGEIWLQCPQLLYASEVASLVQHFLLLGQLWLHYHPAPCF